MKQEQQRKCDYTALSQKKKKVIYNQRMPRWFRIFLYGWLAVILTLAAVGYAFYAVSGGWTPEHLLKIFLLGM